MKKVLLFLIFFFTLTAQSAFAAENWVIQTFQSDITLQEDGKVAIKETLSVDFLQEEKHGIYRDIPYVYEDESGQKTYTDIAVTSVMQDRQPAKYEVTRNDNHVRIRIGDPDVTISGQHVYDIQYHATGVLRSFTDHDELYWNVTGNNWDVDIQKATATVTVPKDKIEQTACFEGYAGSIGACTIEQNAPTKVTFAATETLTSAQGLTIVAGYTKGMVPILTVTPPKTLIDEVFTLPSYLTLGIALLGGIGGALWVWWKNGRDYWFKTRQILDQNARHEIMPVGAHETITVEFEPPEQLRPAELGVLLDEQADTLDVTATIIDLATRGYLTITEEPKKWLFGSTDYVLTLLADKDAGYALKKTIKDKLRPYETLLLKRLFATGETVKVSALKKEFYDDLAEVKTQLYIDLMERKLFANNPESVRHTYLGIGIGIIVLGGVGIYVGGNMANGPLFMFGLGIIISGLLFLLFSRFMPRRTAVGRELYQRAKGYQQFIGGAEKYRQQFYEKKNLFHEVLPYAIVFGLTGKFAQAMKDIGMQQTQPTWYTGARPFHAAHFASDVNGFSKSFSTAIASTPSKSGGFSGGSSGGGFGGGGGGSW